MYIHLKSNVSSNKQHKIKWNSHMATCLPMGPIMGGIQRDWGITGGVPIT